MSKEEPAEHAESPTNSRFYGKTLLQRGFTELEEKKRWQNGATRMRAGAVTSVEAWLQRRRSMLLLSGPVLRLLGASGHHHILVDLFQPQAWPTAWCLCGGCFHSAPGRKAWGYSTASRGQQTQWFLLEYQPGSQCQGQGGVPQPGARSPGPGPDTAA